MQRSVLTGSPHPPAAIAFAEASNRASSGLEIDDELKCRCLLDRNLASFGPPQNLVDNFSGRSRDVAGLVAVGHETALRCERGKVGNGGEAVLQGKVCHCPLVKTRQRWRTTMAACICLTWNVENAASSSSARRTVTT
jgi:hypothetical protein